MTHEDAYLRDRTRILRGRILEALNQFFCIGAPVVQLTQLQSVLGDHERHEIETQCQYLIDKGFATDATRRIDHRDVRGMTAVRITVDGIDLVEGTTTGDGILFG